VVPTKRRTVGINGRKTLYTRHLRGRMVGSGGRAVKSPEGTRTLGLRIKQKKGELHTLKGAATHARNEFCGAGSERSS